MRASTVFALASANDALVPNPDDLDAIMIKAKNIFQYVAHSLCIHSCLVMASVCAMVLVFGTSSALAFRNTDIVVIGDSQISVGSGRPMSRFFGNLAAACAPHVEIAGHRKALRNRSFGMLGIRATSLQSWTTTSGSAWNQLCRRDRRFGVNGTGWGTLKSRRFSIQVGRGAKYQFCSRRRYPIANMFAPGYYRPKVVVFYIGGQGAGRLAGNPARARRDVDRIIAALPRGTRCIHMPTVPIYSARRNRTRARAFRNIKAAFDRHPNRCATIAGFTPGAIGLTQGRRRFFQYGRRFDQWHPNRTASARYLQRVRPALCRALGKALASHVQAADRS